MRIFAAALLALTICNVTGRAREPQLQEGVLIQANQQPIDVPVGHLVPCAVDWNGDGKKDLVIGQFQNGAIRLYLNQGTNAAPVFGDFTFLETGGKAIKLDAG
jgi:hypothetical protein